MATVIEELMITLGLDGSKAKQGMRDMDSAMGSFAESMKSKLLGIGTAITSLYAIQQTFVNYLNEADALIKFSRALELDVSTVDALSRAVEEFGGSAGELQGTLSYINKELSKIATTGNSRLLKITEGMGIDAGELGKKKDTLEFYYELADKFSKMDQQEAIGLGAYFNMSAGQVMLLREGREGVKDLVAELKELGTFDVNDEWVEKFNDNIGRMKKSFMSAAATVFRDIGPALVWLQQKIIDLNIWLREHGTAVKIFLVMIAGYITYLLIPALMELFAVLLTNPITWVILLLAGLALAIEDFIGWANGEEAELTGLWEMFFPGPEGREEAQAFLNDIQEWFVKAWETIQDVWNRFLENEELVEIALMTLAGIITTVVLIALSELAVAILTNPIFWVVAVIMAIIAAFLYWDEIVAWVSESIDSTLTDLANWIDEQFDSIEEWAHECWQAICDKADEVVNSIKGFFVDLKNSIMAAIGEAVDWALGKLASLASAITSLPVVGGAIDYALGGGGGGTTNNTVSSKIGVMNVNVPPGTDGQTFGRNVARGYTNYSRQANGGVIQ